MRWQGTDRSNVRRAAAFLATAATRLAINVAPVRSPSPRDVLRDPSLHRAGRHRRPTPRSEAEQGEALELAVRKLWRSSLRPERACYVLREAFEYPYRQIAAALGLERGAMPGSSSRVLATISRLNIARPVSSHGTPATARGVGRRCPDWGHLPARAGVRRRGRHLSRQRRGRQGGPYSGGAGAIRGELPRAAGGVARHLSESEDESEKGRKCKS